MTVLKKIISSLYRKAALLLLAILAVTGFSVGGTYAYLKWSSEELENNFTAEVSEIPAINETFTENVKSNVTVSVGDTDYSVYVRAVVVATWTNAIGQIHAEAPVEGVDYTLNTNTTDWFKRSDGFFYYVNPVAGNGSTTALITNCTPIKAAPDDGYTLSVQIIAQTIQSGGMTDDGTKPAVTDAWGVVVDSDKKLING